MNIYNIIKNNINNNIDNIKIIYSKIKYSINWSKKTYTNFKNYYYFFKNIYIQNKEENSYLYNEYKNLYTNLYPELENKFYNVKNTKIKFNNCYIGVLVDNNKNNNKNNNNFIKYNINKFNKKIKKLKKKGDDYLSHIDFSKYSVNYILLDRIVILPIDSYFNENKNYKIYIYHVNDIYLYGIYKNSFYDYFISIIFVMLYGLTYYSFIIYAIYKNFNKVYYLYDLINSCASFIAYIYYNLYDLIIQYTKT